MARIPEEEIERIKREASLEQMVRESGIELKPHGPDNLVGLCPFHSEETASLVVTPAKNLFHCFGCGAAGSVIDWVMKTEGVGFPQAVELLRERLGLSAPVKRSTAVSLEECPFEVGMSDQELTLAVIRQYNSKLKQSEQAQSYLWKRGLTDPEIISRFQLGYSDRELGLKIPQKNRKAGAEMRGQLIRIGFLRESGHEHFAGSLTIPVIDERGIITEVYGRKINDNLRAGTPKHLYLPGPHRGVWNWQALKASKEIILCESLIDALTFWCAGYRNVTASYGVEGFTSDHLEAMKRYETTTVYIAYDRDDGGERAAQKLAERLRGEGIECYRVQFPFEEDANQYAQSAGRR